MLASVAKPPKSPPHMTTGDEPGRRLKKTSLAGLVALVVAGIVVFSRGVIHNRAIQEAGRLGTVTATPPWIKTQLKNWLPEAWTNAARETIGPGNSSHFDRVTHVRFSRKKITDDDLAPLQWLKTLEGVSFRYTSIDGSGFRFLENLPDLKEINATKTRVDDAGLRHLSHLENLEALYLSDTRITEEGLPHLRHLANLKTLRIGRAPISDSGLAHLHPLESLEYLDLTGTLVTDAGLAQLHSFPNLRRVILYETEVTEAAASRLRESMPEVYVNHGNF